MKEYSAPSSKSVCHRALICASYHPEKSVISNVNFCDDVLATIDALRNLGASIIIDKEKKTATVCSDKFPMKSDASIYCKDSASTLRLMIVQTLGLNEYANFDGSSQLAKRPMDSYFNFFKENDVHYECLNRDNNRNLPLVLKGNIQAGTYQISAEKSSQFASGLMLYLGSLKAPSRIELIGKTESIDYIRLTAEIMNYYGVETSINLPYINISNTGYKNRNIAVESDFSQLSYFIALGLLSNGILIKNVKEKSLQADRRILEFIEKMGASFHFDEDKLYIYKSKLKACNLDVSECPDLAPTLAGLLSVAEGNSIITGCQRLIYKETDRLHNTVSELKKLGADIQVIDEEIHICGVKTLYGASVSSHNDHRLAMMLSILSPVTEGKIEIDNTACVSKSYPNFFKDLGEYNE